MESKFQTSFIPKKSLDTKSGVRVKTPLNLLALASIIITTLAVVGAGGAFLYKTILEGDIDQKQQELRAVQNSFDYEAAQNVGRIDAKLVAAEELLDNHVAVSNFFSYLEETTLQRLRFSEFSLSAVSKDRIAVIMKGQAKTFEVVAKQSEAFAAASALGGNFVNPIFSDLDLDEAGNVTFTFLSSVNPKLMLYKNKLVENNAVPAAN